MGNGEWGMVRLGLARGLGEEFLGGKWERGEGECAGEREMGCLSEGCRGPDEHTELNKHKRCAV